MEEKGRNVFTLVAENSQHAYAKVRVIQTAFAKLAIAL
jgi:hypothetical protein